MSGAGPRAIPRRPPNAGPAPLSLAQQRLWFLEQLRPGSPVYNIPLAIRLKGPLDLEALARSLDEIVRRHQALRTTFPEVDGRPVQVVREAESMHLPVERLPRRFLGTGGKNDLEAYVRLLAVEEARRPFDLATGPLVRGRLLRLTRYNHVLLLTLHHIVFDGWSAAVFFHELGVHYQAFAAATTQRPLAPLPELPIQYADFAEWQRGRLLDEALAPQFAYWEQQLTGMSEVQLPSDWPRSEIETDRGARRNLVIPRQLTDRLKDLAQQERVTLYMTLLAAFQALLARYTDQDDIAVGSPIAGRTRVETERLIGFFVNTLVLRTDLAGDPTFRELLRRVRSVALGAYANQEVPFERLVAEFRPERSLGRTPLVPVAFALQTAARRSLELPGLTLSHLDVHTGTAKFELSLELLETNDGLRGWIEYSTDLFDPGTIDRLAGHLQTLLDAAVADPDRHLSALPLLTATEQRQLLVEWNATALDFPAAGTVHGQFEAQAARTPEAVAVVCEEEFPTYGELNRQANQLAHHLRSLGVGPEVPVGLCLPRSAAMVVGMLGVLKAGAAYLPLDPEDPPARRASILQDARAPVLVTRSKEVSAPGVRVVCLDEDKAAITRADDANPAGLVTSENLAYVIYTSGSTGQPKGVMVPHRAIIRLVVNTDYVRLGPADVVAQVASPAFDATTFEVWGALLNGARLVILPRDVVLSPRILGSELRRHGVTTLFLTTALFHLLARQEPTALRGLAHVLFGGEVADPRAVAAVLEHGPPRRLLHVYGPTEATTFATWHLVEHVDPEATTIPIGRPIANTPVYVLDSHGRLVPPGVPGELAIGGPGVARGYLNHPQVTTERFLPDQFSTQTGARLYRTGDRVRWRPDGTLEFLCRLDDQVKVRGFRVELGEVEAALNRHAALAQAAVIACQDASGANGLVAYVVARDGAMPTASELRAFLEERLPAYMVPAAFVSLVALPLTASGKVDRDALPAPNEVASTVGPDDAPPRTATEHALAAIWAELLEVTRVGIHDDFFDAGGHSLLVTEVVSRLRTDLGIELPVRAVFEAPTIAQLAERVDAENGGGRTSNSAATAPSSLMVLRAGSSRPPIFFVPGGVGAVAGLFKFAQLARRIGGDQPFYGLLTGDVPDEADEEDVQNWIGATATGYIREIETNQPGGSYILGGTCVGGILAFEMAQQLRARGRQVPCLILMDTPCPAGPSSPAVERVRHRLQGRMERRALRQAKAIGNHQLQSLPPESAIGTDAPAPDADDFNRRGLWLYRYRPRSYPGRVVLFVNEESHRLNPTLGWDAIVAGDLDVHAIPGDHRTYIVDHLDLIADQLRAHLVELPPLTRSDRP
jgi:aspartate racemase